MRARIFWGDSWVGVGLVCGAGVKEGVEREDEEGRVELGRMSEERRSSLRRAIVVRDIVSLEERDSGTGSGCAGLDQRCRDREKLRSLRQVGYVHNF